MAALISVSTTWPSAPVIRAKRAPRQVQDPLAATYPGQFDGGAFPEPMDAQGHEVVHQVVARGDGVEDRAHVIGFLLDRHLLVTEVGGLVVGHGTGLG
jgi:hypothetical protein